MDKPFLLPKGFSIFQEASFSSEPRGVLQQQNSYSYQGNGDALPRVLMIGTACVTSISCAMTGVAAIAPSAQARDAPRPRRVVNAVMIISVLMSKACQAALMQIRSPAAGAVLQRPRNYFGAAPSACRRGIAGGRPLHLSLLGRFPVNPRPPARVRCAVAGLHGLQSVCRKAQSCTFFILPWAVASRPHPCAMA